MLSWSECISVDNFDPIMSKTYSPVIYPGNGRSSFLYFESHFDHVKGFVHIETLKALNLLDVIRLILVACKNVKVSGTLLGLM
jgi:hypothetical protein